MDSATPAAITPPASQGEGLGRTLGGRVNTPALACVEHYAATITAVKGGIVDDDKLTMVAADIILAWTNQGAKMRHLLWYVLTPDDELFARRSLELRGADRAKYRAELARVEREVRRLAAWAIETEGAS